MNERAVYRFLPPLENSAVWELKFSKTDSIPFAALKEHQVAGLLQSKRLEGVMFKFPDVGINQPPFDGFWIRGAEFAWVIVLYYVPRKPKVFYYIDIDDWLCEKEQSKRKSLTRQRASEICRYEKTAP